MTDTEKKAAARQFAADWQGRGDEKQETQSFWLALLRNVYGVADPEKFIDFEVRVKLDHTSFIDGLIRETRVLIEQKGKDIDLHKGATQSDGSFLNPFQQARRYAGYLPHDQNPRWIVVCNFQTFEIHDMNRPNDEPEVVALADLEKEYHRLQFLVDTGDENIKKEMEISLQAGEIVGVLYDALLKQYKDPTDPETLKSLNALCVRLVFCLYAEDAGIFGGHGMFHRFLQGYAVKDVRKALIDLFKVLDTPPEQRDPYMDDELAAFPYVNGGLFSDENIIIPRLNEEIVDLILHRASEDFDWSSISPTIFGAVFESTLNPETRRSGGMHYTSIENIHKVIDPLFLDELKAEFAEIEAIPIEKTRAARLTAFQNKLASLTFLDPACGSGNFLTETYLSLRRLENEAIAARQHGQVVLGEYDNPIRVSISQFYGIEINDFAVTVAKTALWIAESQMMQETEAIVRHELDFLPLKTNAHIIEGNALRLDWESVVPKARLSYIMGNPPFVGHNVRNSTQREDLEIVFQSIKTDKVDYVAAWFYKAAHYMENTSIRAAFVATNSICQGVSVGILWKQMFNMRYLIDFAWPTFTWDSEATDKAHVHVIIVGFSSATLPRSPKLYYDGSVTECTNINGYLLDAPNVCLERQPVPLADVPKIKVGSLPRSSAFTVTAQERALFIADNPLCEKWIKPYIGSDEFINGKERYCLWLKDASPSELRSCRMVMERVERVRQDRLSSPAATTRRAADTPTRFAVDAQPDTNYLVIPQVSSERRRYIPIGFMSPDIIASNLVFIVPNATLYHFGVLTSNVHNAWMRVTCGRMKSDYRYGGDIVYNNFPWPPSTDAQREKIEQTAQAILDARALFPDSCLADLYDETTMPPELRRAHQQNDRAVMQAYGFPVGSTTESMCVSMLMKLNLALTQ